MNQPRRRPLGVGPLRAFEAVARRSSFSAAAQELFVTQPAVSRQIRALEEELGAALFLRGTRHVELTAAGEQLLRAVAPLLDRLDASVRRIRHGLTRRQVTVSTFASFASLWLLPRLHGFQQAHGDIDIRVSAQDAMVDADDPDIDLALRYCLARDAPPGAERLFGEVLTPVASPALRDATDLRRHTLLEEDGRQPSAQYTGWRHWLGQRLGDATLQPRGWIYLNFTYQQIQAALAGQGLALARLALVHEALARGDLVEPFGAAGRITSPYAYWLLRWPGRRERPEVALFEDWLSACAEPTRRALEGVADADPGAAGRGDVG